MTGFVFTWPLALLLAAAAVALAVVCAILGANAANGRHRAAPTTSASTGEDPSRTRTKDGKQRETAGAADLPSDPSVWHLDTRLRTQPALSRYRRFRRIVVASLVSISLALVSAVCLVARPSTARRVDTNSNSRDIVLCLDVSGSALPFDRQVIAAYLDLVGHFRTERIGMSIFNSTSRTVFPLTNDYALVRTQLTKSLRALKGVQSQKSIDSMSKSDYQDIADWLAGTQNRKDATSLIGDGLASCEAMVPRFSANVTSRQDRVEPASIVFATDNVLSGTPMYTLQEALEMARLNSIRVDALFTGADSDIDAPATQDLRRRITAEGGTFLTRTDSDSVAGLVQSIERQKIRQASANHVVDITDQPQPWLVALAVLLALGFALLGWARR